MTKYAFHVLTSFFPGKFYTQVLPRIREVVKDFDISGGDDEVCRRCFKRVIRTLIRIMNAKDRRGRIHSANVVKYAAKIAKILHLSRQDILRIKIAALVHDLGKFEIDKGILYKAGRLTEREWEKVKRHPVISALIMNEVGILKDVSELVKHHHEHFGGGGYPNPHKKGLDIPLGARIIAVADAYDAMISRRPYRPRKLTRKEAITELRRCAGPQFDPQIVAAFTK